MQNSSCQKNMNSNDNAGEPLSGETGSTAGKTVNRIAEAVNEVIDIFGWLGNRLSSSGSVFKIEEARGARAEVSLSIPADGIGEVSLVLGNMRKSYPARALRPGQEFKRGTTVRIADVGVSTMFVDCV